MLDYTGYNFKIERSLYDEYSYFFIPNFKFSELWSFTSIYECIDFVLLWDKLGFDDFISLTKLKNELVKQS